MQIAERGKTMDIEIKEEASLVKIIINGDIEMMTIKSFKQKLFEIGQQIDKDIKTFQMSIISILRG